MIQPHSTHWVALQQTTGLGPLNDGTTAILGAARACALRVGWVLTFETIMAGWRGKQLLSADVAADGNAHFTTTKMLGGQRAKEAPCQVMQELRALFTFH